MECRYHSCSFGGKIHARNGVYRHTVVMSSLNEVEIVRALQLLDLF